jgi:hypothetical protein
VAIPFFVEFGEFFGGDEPFCLRHRK